MEINEPKKEDAPEILSFEKFSSVVKDTHPLSDNFYVYFSKLDFLAPIYKAQPYYIRFAKENPELNERLCSEIEQSAEEIMSMGAEGLRAHFKDLYEAYKIMRSYPNITDHDLFK